MRCKYVKTIFQNKDKGKTLGQVALEKPESLDWYVSSYGGPDNLLRAAAEFLLNAAFTQAI